MTLTTQIVDANGNVVATGIARNSDNSGDDPGQFSIHGNTNVQSADHGK